MAQLKWDYIHPSVMYIELITRSPRDFEKVNIWIPSYPIRYKYRWSCWWKSVSLQSGFLA